MAGGHHPQVIGLGRVHDARPMDVIHGAVQQGKVYPRAT
jgi:hypothetical protein